MRTTVDAVKIIIETELTDPVIEGYIGSASAFVDSALLGAGLTETTLTEIERWLTAHMIASTKERIAKREEAGGAKIEYAGEFGTGFSSTSFGQMAVILDTSGTLKKLNGDTKFASFWAVPQK